MTTNAVRPNLILIMTDNQGPWSLGCYGNEEIRTPNIDRLAVEGVLFERAFCSNAVCSPNRATVLTGLMPSQHGVHRYLAAGGAQTGPEAHSTIAEFRTLPRILHEAGYVCGLTGKWHLGDNTRPQEGFTTWVTTPHGHTTTFYDAKVIEGGEIRTEPTYLTEFWTRRAVHFIEENHSRPFFLFLPYNGPYGLGESMLRPARNRHAAYYADKPLTCFPREEPHPWLHSTRNLINQPAAMQRYASEVSGVDDGVGEVLHALETQGIAENTLVLFTADQGLAGGHSGFWGMGDHTRPLTAFDGTMAIPLILRHPAAIPAGWRREELIGNYHLLPTLLDHLGLAGRIPSSPLLPGHSFAPLLRGGEQPWENIAFYDYENVRAVRTTDWKYVERIHERPNELYHLARDPQERVNRVDDPECEQTRNDLQARLREFFQRHAEPRWDLWAGGASKTRLTTGALFGLDAPY